MLPLQSHQGLGRCSGGGHGLLGIWDSLYLQLNQHNALVKAIPVRRVEKGQLLEYILTDLRVPHSYEVRLTPYTTFGAGDMASRIIHYTERRWWWRRWRWDRWAHLMLRGPLHISRMVPELGVPQSPVSYSVTAGQVPLAPSPALGTLFPGPKPRHPLHSPTPWF